MTISDSLTGGFIIQPLSVFKVDYDPELNGNLNLTVNADPTCQLATSTLNQNASIVEGQVRKIIIP